MITHRWKTRCGDAQESIDEVGVETYRVYRLSLLLHHHDTMSEMQLTTTGRGKQQLSIDIRRLEPAVVSMRGCYGVVQTFLHFLEVRVHFAAAPTGVLHESSNLLPIGWLGFLQCKVVLDRVWKNCVTSRMPYQGHLGVVDGTSSKSRRTRVPHLVAPNKGKA